MQFKCSIFTSRKLLPKLRTCGSLFFVSFFSEVSTDPKKRIYFNECKM